MPRPFIVTEEQLIIARSLLACNFDRSKIARYLGLDKRTLDHHLSNRTKEPMLRSDDREVSEAFGVLLAGAYKKAKKASRAALAAALREAADELEAG